MILNVIIVVSSLTYLIIILFIILLTIIILLPVASTISFYGWNAAHHRWKAKAHLWDESASDYWITGHVRTDTSEGEITSLILLLWWKYSQLSLNNYSLKRLLPLSDHFINNHFVSQSIFLCLDFSLKRPPSFSDHFFLHQGWSPKRELTVLQN